MNAKEIILKAIDLIEEYWRYNNDFMYMCYAIEYAVYNTKQGVTVPQEVIDLGFTRDNYFRFVEEHYPELGPDLYKDWDDEATTPWISTTFSDNRKLCMESKINFLKSLVNEEIE